MATDFGDFINMAKSRARSSGNLSQSQRATSGQNFMRNAAGFLGGPFGVMNSAVNVAKNSPFGQSIANKGNSMPTRELDRSVRTQFDPPVSREGDALLDRMAPNGRWVLNGQTLIKNPDVYASQDDSEVSNDKWNVGTEGRRERHEPVDPDVRKANQMRSTMQTALGNLSNKASAPNSILSDIAGALNQRKSEILPDTYYDILLKNNPNMSATDGLDWLEQTRATGPVHVPIATDYDPNTLDHYQDYDYPGGFSDFMYDTWPGFMRTIKDYGEDGAAPLPTIPYGTDAGALSNMIENGTINMTDPSAVINLMPSYGLPGFEWGHGFELPGTRENYINTILRRNANGANPFMKAPGVRLEGNGYFIHPEYPNIIPPREQVLPYQDEDDMYIYGRG